MYLQTGSSNWQANAEAQKEELLAYRQRILHFRMMTEHSISLFLKTEGYFCFDPEGRITSRELYSLYSRWCREQGILPKASRTFLGYLKEHSVEYRVTSLNSVPSENGKRVRGFRGIRARGSGDTQTGM